jgi:hypothetical protein
MPNTNTPKAIKASRGAFRGERFLSGIPFLVQILSQSFSIIQAFEKDSLKIFVRIVVLRRKRRFSFLQYPIPTGKYARC